MTQMPAPFPPPPVPYATPFVSPDDSSLRLISIFHYIWGGLTALILSIFIIHIVLGIMMLSSPSTFSSSGQPPPPAFAGWMLIGLGTAAVLIGWTIGGLTIYSGRCIARRRHHMFSLVMAGINCLSVPLARRHGCVHVYHPASADREGGVRLPANDEPGMIHRATLTALLLLASIASATRAAEHRVEPWADPGVPVKDGLLLWLDATRRPRRRRRPRRKHRRR